MKTLIILFFLLLNSLSASSLLTIENNAFCVDSYYLQNDDIFYYRSDDNLTLYTSISVFDVKENYQYIDNKCVYVSSLEYKKYSDIAIGIIVTFLIIWSLA